MSSCLNISIVYIFIHMYYFRHVSVHIHLIIVSNIF
jgi:hypothetical protein